MKVKLTVEGEVTVRATLRGKQLEVALTASVPYGEDENGNPRTASHTITEGFEKEYLDGLKNILQALLESKGEEAVRVAARAANQAESYARSKGEAL